MLLLRRLGRALVRRCPHCGSPGIFRRWLRMVDVCPRCELRFEREEGYWLGAILVNTVVTLISFGAGMVLWGLATWPDPPWGLMTGVGIAFNTIFPILLYPYSKTIWVAVEITAHPPGDR